MNIPTRLFDRCGLSISFCCKSHLRVLSVVRVVTGDDQPKESERTNLNFGAAWNRFSEGKIMVGDVSVFGRHRM